MSSLEAAENAHYARLDAAYQRELDDYAEGQAAADKALFLADTIQDLEDAGWTLSHLETRGRYGFDRYDIGYGITFWACPDCAGIEADPDKGCEACGYGTPEHTEM